MGRGIRPRGHRAGGDFILGLSEVASFARPEDRPYKKVGFFNRMPMAPDKISRLSCVEALATANGVGDGQSQAERRGKDLETLGNGLLGEGYPEQECNHGGAPESQSA